MGEGELLQGLTGMVGFPWRLLRNGRQQHLRKVQSAARLAWPEVPGNCWRPRGTRQTTGSRQSAAGISNRSHWTCFGHPPKKGRFRGDGGATRTEVQWGPPK